MRRSPIFSAVHVDVHAVQFYETDAYLIETLVAYVGGALRGGEAAIVVATPEHRAALESRLAGAGVDSAAASERGAFVTLDAEELLGRFYVNGSVDGAQFHEIVGSLITRTRGENARTVRVFGEMVAILWSRGDRIGALAVEAEWNALARVMPFALLCAYPVSLFSDDDRLAGSVESVTALHESPPA